MSRFFSTRWRGRGVVCVLAAVMALPLVSQAGSVVADDRPPVSCPDGVCSSPPPLLSLDRGAGAAAATPARVVSLRKLEKQAVERVLVMRGLSASGTNAVLAWGRPEAQAQLFTLLVAAIEASPRTVDQQNAVDWLAAMARDKAVAAANAAGREYVKWAGLNLGRYERLLNRNASQDELREFLNDPVNGLAPGGGYCDYWPPAPYESEFSSRDEQMCSTPCTGLFGCLPQPPTFDQFVRWGQAAASYEFLKSAEFARTAPKIAVAIGVSAAVYAAFSIGGTVTASIGPGAAEGFALAMGDWGDIAPWAEWIPSALTPYSSLTVVGFIGVVTTVITAIVIAVLEGIAVVTAAELPGQLAELISDARTNAPDVAELTESTDGVTSLLAMFVAATLPAPMDDYCDNSLGPWFEFAPDVWAYRSGPCLNAPAIPAASQFDPQFVITEEGKPGRTVSRTITWRDPDSGTTPTARLHDNWFITEPTGSFEEQTLSIYYTGWDGERRSAFVLGEPDHGHAFVSLNVSGDLSGLDDCLDNGLCAQSETLEYLGPDGEKLSASLERWRPPVGAPAYDPTPDEEFASSYDANGFAPGNATDPVEYQWRFEEASDCPWWCVPPVEPSYGAPVSGETVTHRWLHPGPFRVELTATDAEDRSATTTFEVYAHDVAPRIEQLVPDCPTEPASDPLPGPCLPRTGAPGTARHLRGVFVDASRSHQQVEIHWGDGGVARDCVTDLPPVPPFHCDPGAGNGLELTRTGGHADTNAYAFDASHVYTEPGIYPGTITVSDQFGSSSETFTMTIGDTAAVEVSTHTHDGVVEVAEDGATSRDIDVRLAAQPSTDVTVYLAVDNHHDVDVPDTLTFTPDNWDRPQPVTVRAVDDDHHEPNPHHATITIGVRGGPDAKINIDGVVHDSSRATVSVEIADNDQAGMIVSPTTLTLTEGGPPATVTVGISSTPADGRGVDVRASTSGLCTVTPDRLTNIEHNEPQNLTVTPGRDHHPGSRPCTLSLTTESSDPDYDRRRVDITGTVTNIDIPAVTITPTQLVLDTTTANPTATYQIGLDTRPFADVEIAPDTTDPDVTVSGPVTFTADNWDHPQTVTLTAPAGTAPHATVVTHEVTSDDTAYRAITPSDVHVAVGDPTTTITLNATPDQPTTTKPVTVTATLTAGVGTPTGRLVFDGISRCEAGSLECDIPIVDGVARLDPGLLALGTHTITATYDGDTTHRPARATIELDVEAGTPEPAADTITITEDAGPTTIDVLANDPAAEVLTIAGNTPAEHGDVSCDQTSCSYTPHPDFHGDDTFTYTVTEGTNTAAATVNVTVEPVNDSPVANDDTATTAEDTDVTIDVVGNDSDVDGDELTVASNTATAHGDVSCDETSCTYTPNRDFHGDDTFTYTATDSTETATATVTITVEPVNDSPVANDDTITVTEDAAATSIDVLANDSDVEDSALTVADHSQPDHGDVSCDQTSCTYTPGRDFHGDDAFSYTVSDGTTSTIGAVTVTIEPVNDPPVADDDTATTPEDTDVTIDVVGNDSDVDNATLAVDDHSQPEHGDVSCDQTSCSYTPNRDFHGDDTFTYTVTDGTETATATVTVTINPVNDPPVADDDTATTSEDTDVTIDVVGNDSDVDSATLAVDDHSQPEHGDVSCDQTSCSYTPNRDFHGDDTFTYTVTDGTETATATVSVTVTPVNDPPVAVDDAYLAVEDTTLEIAAADGVLDNDGDVDGDEVTAVVEAAPTHGTLTLAGDGSFIYTPEAGYHGPDTFTYRAGDVHGWSPAATVSLTVVAAAATVTQLTATPNPSRAGQPATFTATVTATGIGVTAGTVTFADGATTLAEVAVDDQGRASYTTATLDDGMHQITATYHPAPRWLGSTSSPLNHLVDSDAPRANPTLSPRPNAAGWHHAPVTVTWNWTDQGAGVDPSHCPARSSTNREGRHVLTATCRDAAGNQSTTRRTVRVDRTAPTVAISAPAARRYYQHAGVTANYTCRDTLSGVAACTGTVADGAPIDTSTIGTRQFTVTARDVAGNESTAEVTYVVSARPTCHGRPATIIGTAASDVITGTARPDVIVTGGGRDSVRARGGDDTICSGAGRDQVFGGPGSDTINGGSTGDLLVGGPGTDNLRGGTGNDLLVGNKDGDHLAGGPGTDTCRGGPGTDHATTCEVAVDITRLTTTSSGR